jgi:hypothetical protein
MNDILSTKVNIEERCWQMATVEERSSCKIRTSVKFDKILASLDIFQRDNQML